MKKMNIIEKWSACFGQKFEPFITITMTDPQAPENLPSSSSSSSKSTPEISNNTSTKYSGQKKLHYPNPPESTNPDPATLREQWRFAIRQYSKWYSHAWGTAILAGLSFFAIGWIVKGSNPLPSFKPPPPTPTDADDHSTPKPKPAD
ncbi:hypothetical protein Dsin_021097 [Dipteronia sinensis]|uniref:Uncharacterized protein n=1 Tax=Dipteronia sinensis TaxID=43782 RepID=A0AAE0AAK6_9ROSI|nr:hypothetical protein Dsin_021097 [Dipteronia sinensis]